MFVCLLSSYATTQPTTGGGGGGGRGGAHTFSNPGYLPLCHVDTLFLVKVTIFWVSRECGGRDKPTK